MVRFLAALMLGGVTIAQLSFTDAEAQQIADNKFIANADGTPGNLPTLPAAPRGKSTVIGGAIHDVDPVRDQLTLNVSGAKQRMKILFDERTQVYRDGVKTSLRDLRPNDHASVETVLDGTSVFALSIHMLSQSPEGECQGQVVAYDSATGELTLNDILSREPIKLRVPAGTSVVREGQAAATSTNTGPPALANGTLISVKFKSDNQGRGVADQIAILATPGSAFVFSGDVAFLDLHSEVLVVVDPRDDKSYKISFDPGRFPVSKDLHEGSHVRVTANFDGTHYVANEIALK